MVCCHTDKDHIHTHIVFNAVTLDYGQKFQNFKDSAARVRELSDAMCRENGLSVVEEPDAGKSYKEWDADRNGKIWKAKLQEAIYAALQAEYTELVEKKKALYADYTRLKEEARELATVKQNVDRLLSVAPEQPEPERKRPQR